MATARLITAEEKAQQALEDSLPGGVSVDFGDSTGDGSGSEETTEPTAIDSFLGYFKSESGEYDLVKVGGGIAVAAIAVYAVRRVL
jgi:hypothetical protein